jgi:diguanylate cyclase (GGDEF)-like protein
MLGLGVALVVGVAWTRTRRPAPLASVRTSTGSVAVPPQPAHGLDELLEVGRRLTAATAAGDIERAVVREARGLVVAKAAALVRISGEELVVTHETRPDLLVKERLGDGLIGRVAQTGQPVVQVSSAEPAIRNLPAALLAAPLVGGGRVDAILVLVRGDGSPFSVFERDRIMALAPTAAAAMQSAREAHEKTYVDALTGAGNRRRLDAELPRILELAEGRPTAVCMLDLDHFKAVNDTFGHPAGDALLRAVAQVLRLAVRPGDAIYRYGGEEFCIVLPDTDTEAASAVAERMRAAIAGVPFDVGAPEPLVATASLGVAAARNQDAATLIERADAALYEAKNAGRNQVARARSGA